MIRLRFSRQADILSDIIAWFSQGTFSHVDAITSDNGLLGARSDCDPGVRVRSWNYANFVLRIVADIPCTEKQYDDFWSFLDSQIGKPYDQEAILAFAVDRDWREDDSWICSELQAAALEYAGVFPKLYLAANKITPVALALAVSTIPGTKFTQLKDPDLG